MLKPIDLSAVHQGKCSTDALNMTIERCMFDAYAQEALYTIDELIVHYGNLEWLAGHIDELRLDPSFQDVIGLDLEKHGYTSSVEVQGGISKTMGNIVTRILGFFGKLIVYMDKVMSINCKASADLVKRLNKACSIPANVDLLKTKYTTRGESVRTITALFNHIKRKAKDITKSLNDLKAAQTNEEKTYAQGQQQQSKTTDNRRQQLLEQLKTESGNGGDRRDNQNGVDPVNGGWFNPADLARLQAALGSMDNYIGELRQIESNIKSQANTIKSDTQMNKSMAKTKLATINAHTKTINEEVKLIMKYSTIVGKTCQTILNCIKDKQQGADQDADANANANTGEANA